MNPHGGCGTIDLGYVLPIRRHGDGDLAELTAYLRWLGEVVDVVVVDGSEPELFEEAHHLWDGLVRHIPPDPRHRCLNGKVWGVRTGMEVICRERVVIADDDVRYDMAGLVAMADALGRADLVRPQNYFEPLPWHAAWDTARILLNRSVGADSPGTLGLRRSVFRTTGGYDGDVLYENLELIRTVECAGGAVAHRPDLYVRRAPPTFRRFLEQRPRQAYDDLAQPAKLALLLAVLPTTLVALRGPRRRLLLAVAGLIAGSMGLAERGRRRAGGTAVFPLPTVWWAPVWVVERSLTVWWAIWARLVRGGVRYGGSRLVVAANSRRRLRVSLRVGGTSPNMAPVAEGSGAGPSAPAEGDHRSSDLDALRLLVLEHDRSPHQQGPLPVGTDHHGGAS